MKPLSADTTPEAQSKQVELMRHLSPSQKLALAFALTDTMRDQSWPTCANAFRARMQQNYGDVSSLEYCLAKT